jgi:hypothetical protein
LFSVLQQFEFGVTIHPIYLKNLNNLAKSNTREGAMAELIYERFSLKM